MANFQGNLSGFNAEEVEPQTSREPFAAGWKLSVISDSEMKRTKKDDGEYLQLEWTIVEGEDEGRKAWSNLNLDNPNQTTVEIAQRELSSICRAVGVMTPNDSTDLHDRPIWVKWKVKPGKDSYEPRNEPVEYRAADDPPAQVARAASRPAAPPSTNQRAPRAAAPAAGRGPAPWKKA